MDNSIVVDIKELKPVSWVDKLKQAEDYIAENNQRPSSKDKNKEIKILGQWISYQCLNYKDKKECMKKVEIYDMWTNFIEKHKQFFLTEQEEWDNNKDAVGEYIDKNHKLPSAVNKDISIARLGQWLTRNKQSYKNDKFDDIMKAKWVIFIDKYKEYLIDNLTEWNLKLEELKEYLDKYCRRPSKVDPDVKVKQLNAWLSTQINSYRKKDKIMKNEDIYIKWTEFVKEKKYKEYFSCDII